MYTLKSLIFRGFERVKIFFGVFILCALFVQPAHAFLSFEDAFNLSHFVPLVLESMMTIATSLYDFFVGNGKGLIYIFIYLFLGFHIGVYLVKMYLPKDWLGFFGFSEGGEMWTNKLEAWSIIENIGKPCMRAIIAIVLLLQIRPTFVTEWVVNPFLEFGSIYTEQVLKFSGISSEDAEVPTCPQSINDKHWITERGCDFLIRPVHIISYENNRIIKYGIRFLKSGLQGTLSLIPHGGENFLNIITGILLIGAFVSSNLFMALLIIQAIFDFCLALIMYPFSVVTWVVKKSDKWFDIFPAFKQIIEALKKLVITMIACAFILCINIAVVRAIFNWSSSAFNVASGGVATSNVPSMTNAGSHFGHNIMLCISAVLTFFLMQSIFKLTRERLDMYSGVKHTMYDNVTNDAKLMWGKAKAAPDTVKTWVQTGQKIKSIFGK